MDFRQDDNAIRETRSRRVSRRSRTLAGALALLALGACGSMRQPPPTDPDDLADYKAANDPYEPLNRKMYNVQMWAYHKVLRPVGKAWIWAIPKPVRHSIANINETWREPAVFFSDVGAGKPRRAGDAFMRFAINMSAGVGGFFDVAGLVGYNQHETDPGLTMGTWGVASGPYLFIPFVGPSNFRDGAGYGIGQGLTPINYVPRGYDLLTFNWAYNVAGTMEGYASSIDQIDHVEQDSLDPYSYIRSAWQQNRQSQIDTIKNDDRATTPDWYN